MKTSFKFLFLLLFFILFTSCDPSHDIFFKNKTASNVKVKINIEPKAIDDLKSIATNDSIVFNLAKDSTAMISFGIGNWSAKEIEIATNSIKGIEIETSDSRTIYKTKKAIHSVLDKNVHGIVFKGVIEINID